MKRISVFGRIICLMLVFVMLLLSACSQEEEKQVEEPTEKPVVTVKAFRVKDDFKAGDFLGVKDIELVDVDKSTIPADYLTKTSTVVGRALLVDIAEGEFLGNSMLKAAEKDTPSGGVSVSLAKKLGFVVATDYLTPNTDKDLSEEIQKLIDTHPRKTIYFPDGVYTIKYPIMTSSNPSKAVSLHLSGNAVIKASDDWRGRSDYMVQLGAIEETFTIDQAGSNYYFYGGVIDGNDKAKALILEGGRETSVRQVAIRNAVQGLYVTYNKVYASNDCDFESISIEGAGTMGSVGLYIDGLDNTFTDIRISNFEIGVKLQQPGNLMHNILPVFEEGGRTSNYVNSIGFYDVSGGNWYDGCYSEDFAIGFHVAGSTLSTFINCAARWTGKFEGSQTAIYAAGRFNSVFTNPRFVFTDGAENSVLKLASTGGGGIIQYPAFDKAKVSDDTYKQHLVGSVVWSK